MCIENKLDWQEVPKRIRKQMFGGMTEYLRRSPDRIVLRDAFFVAPDEANKNRYHLFVYGTLIDGMNNSYWITFETLGRRSKSVNSLETVSTEIKVLGKV